MAQKKKLPTDTNKKAKSIVDLATGEDTELSKDEISKAMSIIGKLGGKKGGAARAKSLSAKKRSEIAKKAAKARWNKKED